MLRSFLIGPLGLHIWHKLPAICRNPQTRSIYVVLVPANVIGWLVLSLAERLCSDTCLTALPMVCITMSMPLVIIDPSQSFSG